MITIMKSSPLLDVLQCESNDDDITTKHKNTTWVPQDEIIGLGHIASERRSWTEKLSGRVTDSR